MKAILVIDEMPKGCCECNMAIDLCHGTIPSQEWYDKRPSWCPLKPMPNKQATNLAIGIDLVDGFKDGWNYGWNACIDEITGDDNE